MAHARRVTYHEWLVAPRGNRFIRDLTMPDKSVKREYFVL